MAALSAALFNQTGACIAACPRAGGLRVFNADPLCEKLRLMPGFFQQQTQPQTPHPPSHNTRQASDQVLIAQLLHRSNYIVLVTASDPCAAKVWDDGKRRIVLEYRETSRILSVNVRVDRIVLTLLTKVKVYAFHPTAPNLLHTFATLTNDAGLTALATYPSPTHTTPPSVTLAFAGRASHSHIQIAYIPIGAAVEKTAPSTLVIAASSSNSSVSAIALSPHGGFVCTANTGGTVVRVYASATGVPVAEFRRGREPARIVCGLAVSWDARWICVGTIRGTVHVFRVSKDAESLDAGGGSIFQPQSLSADAHTTVLRSPPVVERVGSSGSSTKRRSTQTASLNNSAPASIASQKQRTNRPPSSSITAIRAAQSTNSAASEASAAPSRRSTLPPSLASAANRSSSLSFLSPLSKYFGSSFSFATCSVAPGVPFVCAFSVTELELRMLLHGHRNRRRSSAAAEASAVVARISSTPSARLTSEILADGFVEDNADVDHYRDASRWSPDAQVMQRAATSLLVVGLDGSYYKFALDIVKGGECVLERHYRLNANGYAGASMGGSSGRNSASSRGGSAGLGAAMDRVGETGMMGMEFGMSVG
ncbi:WD repeat domain phosphoinositide-interacting protein 3 [Entophlyctis luteolus]|nr:WD repeat domain phosphoinositide-interacting protein 3 [Entophlyctis luteolus]